MPGTIWELTIFAKSSILDVRLGSKDASESTDDWAAHIRWLKKRNCKCQVSFKATQEDNQMGNLWFLFKTPSPSLAAKHLVDGCNSIFWYIY